ncbi:Uu.00g076050.m01.CDS01 [Anthostomella pinea]|uniref:Uu.00g076050.m01.CDS01 n=1 Tax=Anthostomella pinea TaxID=933095 RepID=A0AAI8VWD2_9PEZI|nr:Uu.00g076050.m01.CDS01 [Anthostomella pinea]
MDSSVAFREDEPCELALAPEDSTFIEMAPTTNNSQTRARFEPASAKLFRWDTMPPTIEDLRAWLECSDTLHVFHIINSAPTLNALRAYRSSSRTKSRSQRTDFSTFVNMVGLFQLSREDLRARIGLYSILDFHAAIFAHQVVRFLEGPSCGFVSWTPVSDRWQDVENRYEIACRRWVIVLKLLWFLEANVAFPLKK